MEKVIGVKVVIQVNGFQDAKQWIYRLVDAGVARCAECDSPATGVFWNDQAEWYCLCDNHMEYGRQWTGSTRWNPRSFSKIVIPDKAREWIETLSDSDKKRVWFVKFDATDYDALLPEDWWDKKQKITITGDEKSGIYIDVHQLTNGLYAYQKTMFHPGFSRGCLLEAPFESVDECVEHATKGSK